LAKSRTVDDVQNVNDYINIPLYNFKFYFKDPLFDVQRWTSYLIPHRRQSIRRGHMFDTIILEEIWAAVFKPNGRGVNDRRAGYPRDP
jgi:hypothetical protein